MPGLKILTPYNAFIKNMSELSDSWLTVRLGSALNKNNSPGIKLIDFKNAANISLIEKLLKAGWLAQLYVQSIDRLRRPGACNQFMNLTVIYPRNWRSTSYQRMKVQESRKEKKNVKARNMEKKYVKHKSKVDVARIKRNKLVKEIKHIESIQKKASLCYSELVTDAQKTWNQSEKPRAKREKGIIERVFTYFFGKALDQGEFNKKPNFEPPKVDEIFVSKLTSYLTAGEKETYKEFIELEEGITEVETEVAFENYAGGLEELWWDAVHGANDLCSEIQLWEEEATKPDSNRPPQQITETNRPSVRGIGFGELIVARERLIGYEANEIAHIENVLPHEDRFREHERTTTREVVTETETEEETKSEKHLETTDRYELQTQSEKAINEKFSIDAGVNTSGKYGLTTIETSLEAEFSRSVDESHRNTTNLAKEVVSRAVEETYKSARELRRVNVTEQIRELNRHGINAKDENDPFSGVYSWVEKIHEVELRHYGTRLMVEFYNS